MQILFGKFPHYVYSIALCLTCFTIFFPTLSKAEPVEDVMKVCTRQADDLLGRVKKFEALGWMQVSEMDDAARALADASALANPPIANTKDAWGERLAIQNGLKEHLNWAHILEFDHSFVYLNELSVTDPTGNATCLLVTSASQRGADIFSEAEALGTLEYDRGVYRGTISRTTMQKNTNGWISVIFAVSLGPDAILPRKLASSKAMTFVNGKLRD